MIASFSSKFFCLFVLFYDTWVAVATGFLISAKDSILGVFFS
jgi:hypothetical protein